jgi:Fic family protein
MSEFKYYDLKLVVPLFESNLTNLIIDLDYLRKKEIYGTTPPLIFFQLKSIFHMVESLASARIEGNNTTVAEYIESKIEKSDRADVGVVEIQNMEQCLEFIDQNIATSKIDRSFISELHKMTVTDLPLPPDGEGDMTPGQYRQRNIAIKGSGHVPPESVMVPEYMDQLFEFIETQNEPKYDLLKAAIAHHRFVWIHPFTNGNGRTVRLFTYAMLVKYGFKLEKGQRIVNPAAVFCNRRDEYYSKLALADSGEDAKILGWCEYVLTGLKTEIEKVDSLLDYSILTKKILLPAIAFALDRKLITDLEHKVLKRTVEQQVVKASDLTDIVPTKHRPERSRVIHRLVEQKMLLPISENARRYTLNFSNNYLLRGVIKSLYEEGFVPE